MPAANFFDAMPLVVFFLFAVVVALAAIELGYRLGLQRKRVGAEAEAPVGASVGATMGLLAFTLGFTFAMSADRFSTRKEMVVKEANAIGTTYLRTSLVPDPPAAKLRQALREYVDVRLDVATHPENFAAAMQRVDELQAALWKEAAALGVAEPTHETISLFIDSLNQMIDVHGERLAAFRNRIPTTIWVFLFVTAVVGMLGVGYHSGLSGARRTLATFALVIAFSGVIMLIADLDRPQQGFLHVSQQSMLDLQKTMKAAE